MSTDFVYLGEALRYFFNHASINIYQGNIEINLMNLFPFLKGRYALNDTVTQIFKLYLSLNNLFDPTHDDIIIPDDLIFESFGSNIPAVSYLYINERGTVSIASMNIGVKRGSISQPLNTFEVLGNIDEFFDPLMIEYADVSEIIGTNIYKSKALKNHQELLADKTFMSNLETECKLSAKCEIIIRASQAFKEQLWIEVVGVHSDRMSLSEFITTALKTDSSLVVGHLIRDPWVYLLYAIIINRYDLVIEGLKNVDPRIHDNEAYKLALKKNNSKIIKAIQDSITRKMLLERQALNAEFESLVGPTNIPQTLFPSIQFL